MRQNTAETNGESVDAPQAQAFPAVLRIAWHHKALVALGVVAGLIVGGLVYAQATPLYQSTALVLVENKRPDAPLTGIESRRSGYDDYLNTHKTLIKSPVIVQKAIEKGKLQALESMKDQDDPVGFVIGGLIVKRDTEGSSQGNRILKVAFRGPVPEDCGPIVNAVIDSYKDFLDTTYRNVSDETVKLIAEATDLFDTRLQKKRKEYREFRLANTNLWRGKAGTSFLAERLAVIELKRTTLSVRETEIKNRLDAFDVAMKEGRSRAELMTMVSESLSHLSSTSVEGAPTGSSMRYNIGNTDSGKVVATTASATTDDPLHALFLEYQKLAEELAENHPRIKALRGRMEALRTKGQKLQAGSKQDELDPLYPVHSHINFLRRELADVQVMEKALDRLVKGEQSEVQKVVRYDIQDEDYQTDVKQLTQLFDSVAKRLEETNILKNFGGYTAECIAPPGVGGRVSPKALPIFAIAGAVGLLLGFGLAYLADVSDHSFRTAEEIRRRLGLPVVGHIPTFTPKEAVAGEAGLAPILCTYYQSRSREAEAYRGVRTALLFSTRGGGHKVIQVTSPDMGDGKTTLAANLAVSLAQSSKRVILIDADFRRPRLHDLFGLANEQGLASVIAGDGELSDVVQETGMPGLSVLPCGPIPPNPAELLTLPRFREMLAVLRDRYDYVIVDTPPLLAVTDPCVVAPYVDGVLLVIRLHKQARPQAERARDMLATLSANVVGVVVNGMDRHGAGGYGYGYGKGYGSDGYYAEDNGEVQRPAAERQATVVRVVGVHEAAPEVRTAAGRNGGVEGDPRGGEKVYEVRDDDLVRDKRKDRPPEPPHGAR
jgi:capsular exopolysaccharide synthesis family protein